MCIRDSVEAAKERFLKNLYEMKEGGKPKGYKMVADCLEGADPDIIKELEQEGLSLIHI